MGSRALAVLVALLALLPAAAPAVAAPTVEARLAATDVERIAKAQQKASVLVGQHVLAKWTSTFDAGSGRWTAVLKDPPPSFPLVTVTVDDATGKAIGATVPGEVSGPAKLTSAKAKEVALSSDRAREWVQRYRDDGRKVTDQTRYDNGTWTYRAWADGKQVADVAVDDKTATIKHVRTGPQVAWSMARGNRGSFGRRINDPEIFYALLGLFILGLVNWRRPFSLRTVDVLMLASLAVSWELFNHGLVFWCVPLQYPALVWACGRLLAIGLGRRGSTGFAPFWPAWILIAAAVFAMGFRVGLDLWASNVVDVGYASVVGADRIVDGRSPYGNMPQGPPEAAKPCGVKYADGNYSAYVQKDGACESPVGRGDTYGPAMYAAYVPATVAMNAVGERWTGRWDGLPIARATSIAFDLLAALGLFIAGFRLGRLRLAAVAVFVWAAYPFTAFALNSNSNDMIVAACVAWALALLPSPFFRGLLVGFGLAAKFSPVLLVPLLVRADRPGARRLRDVLRPGPGGIRTGVGVGAAIALSFGAVVVALDGIGGLRTFWDRTFGWQLDRPSPFSIWDWGEYPGFPDLALLQTALKLALVLGAAGLFLWPRRLDPVRVAALCGALLAGFQIVLTHWMYLYVPWWVPGLALGLFAARPALEPLRRRVPAPAADDEPAALPPSDPGPAPYLGVPAPAPGG